MPLDPQHVHERLREAARRFRWSRCTRYLLSGSALGLALLTALLLADAQFHFGSATRWVAFLLVISPFLAGIALTIRAALPSISEASIARRIETAADGSRNTLISAVQFDRELAPNSGFRTALFQEMNDPFPQVDWSRVFDFELLKRLAIGLGTVVLLMGTFAAIRPLYFVNSAARILLPGRAIAPLTRTQIASLTPGSTRVINGRDLLVSVRLAGQIPKGVWLLSREPGGNWQKVLMDHEIGSPEFTCAWKEVREPFAYRIEAGDALSPVYEIAVRPRTAIVARTASIEPPAYTRLGKETRREFAALQGLLPGSNVSLALTFNAPLQELRCNSGMTAQKTSDTTWNVSGVVKGNISLRVDYRDTDDITDSETLQIATTPDEPPRIAVTAPPEGKEIFATRDDLLSITYSATDNYGLESVALYRTTDETQEAELIQVWNKIAGKKSFSATLKVPLAKYAKDDRVTLALVAKDQNDVSGPGVTWSRPIIVTLRSQNEVKEQEESAAKKAMNSFEALIKLQATNLERTQAALGTINEPATKSQLPPLLERQSQIAEMSRALAASTEAIAPEARTNLQALVAKEMPEAILALRAAVTGADATRQTAALAQAIPLEAAILARLQGTLKTAENDAAKGKIQDLISGVEELLRNQRELYRDTNKANGPDAKALAERQDALSEKSVRVRKGLEKAAQDGSIGDQDFRNRLTKVAAMFGEMAIYEQMLSASEQLLNRAFPAAATIQKEVIDNLAKLVELLNQWQLAAAQREADSMKKVAKAMVDKLEKLAQIQREVVEKSKEIARKADMRPEDVATADEMKKGKDLMAEVVEQMLTDAHVFPDMKPSNELRGELTQIYEDVIQADKADAAAGNLTAKEVAVQKEDSLLQAIEQAKKVAEDLEMWLPNKLDTAKFLMENFDKTEMPEIPNLPLPDAFEDLVGDLLQEQEGLAEKAQDAASNQALAMAQQGWSVADGPMPGFSAQGKSGNTRPNHNEQMGRSSGGREGMSNGEMVGDTASNLQGDTPETRRSNDPMQQGQVKDDGGIQEARATGGGKAGGFSDRNGMDGNAPLRASNAPRMAASDALAVQQALLAEKTSKTYSQASLLYLRAKGLPGVARLMDQSQAALKEGRMDDFRNLHQKIVTQLNEAKGNILPGDVVSLTTGDTARAQDKQLLGGDEGQAPPAYKKAVADYYRALQE
ncbi:MAG: hypothetical protein NTZ46_08640 [Verrucomicrobia bacterium]|nr:hypothetical protein [Verrucomicrobiota bacterium]